MEETKQTKHSTVTAYHEAGHAMAAIAKGIPLRARRTVTIIPDEKRETLGYCRTLNKLRENPEFSTSARTRAIIEDEAVVLLAGDAAQRRFKPRSHHGWDQDLKSAYRLLEFVSCSEEVCRARLKVANLTAKALVDLHWHRIEAIATALMEHGTLNRGQVFTAIKAADATKIAAAAADRRTRTNEQHPCCPIR